LGFGISVAAEQRRSASIAQFVLTAFAGAVRAAEHLPAGFHPMPDDLASAVLALRRHHRNRAFEAVEHVGLAVFPQLKRFVVIVAAQFAFSHRFLLSPVSLLRRSARALFSGGSRLRALKQTPNAERRTPNVEVKVQLSRLDVRRWAFGVCF
jgi:hypothetical protein